MLVFFMNLIMISFIDQISFVRFPLKEKKIMAEMFIVDYFSCIAV